MKYFGKIIAMLTLAGFIFILYSTLYKYVFYLGAQHFFQASHKDGAIGTISSSIFTLLFILVVVLLFETKCFLHVVSKMLNFATVEEGPFWRDNVYLKNGIIVIFYVISISIQSFTFDSRSYSFELSLTATNVFFIFSFIVISATGFGLSSLKSRGVSGEALELTQRLSAFIFFVAISLPIVSLCVEFQHNALERQGAILRTGVPCSEIGARYACVGDKLLIEKVGGYFIVYDGAHLQLVNDASAVIIDQAHAFDRGGNALR